MFANAVRFCLLLGLGIILLIKSSLSLADSGFSGETEGLLKRMILERIHSDPDVFKDAVQALIERE